MRGLAIAVLLAACSPYKPDLPAEPFYCGSGAACPDGYMCVTANMQSVCSDTGSGEPADATRATDGPPAVDAPHDTCAHDLCTTGAKLTGTCDPCVEQICASDSYCCDTKWSSQCVDEVSSICGETTCDGGSAR